jgi:Ca2+-binding RTX toxin-like protein
MPTVEIRNNVVVGIPHTFIVIKDSNGTEHGFGFYPATPGSPNSAGTVKDDTQHEYTSSSVPVELTDAEFDRLADYIQKSIDNPPPYAIAYGSMCTTWAINGLIEAAGVDRLPGYPDMSPNGFWRDVAETIIWNPITVEILVNAYKDVNNNWQSATTPPRRDPLAIDLDGDGIETVGIPTDGSTPILFDHDADGVKTGTGWLQPDDGWLVLDRDGNGNIDSGRELFGVDTYLPGPNRNAYNGFEALNYHLNAEPFGGAGYGDGVLDSRDAAFTQLRVWRDANGDGASQADELSTLSAAGIASIGLTPTNSNIALGNGNTITGTATVTRSNGQATQAGTVDLSAGNLTLASNPFYREFPDTIALTEEAAALPEMGGSGWLRDLREAMSLGTAEAAALSALVQQFAAATSRDAQMAALDDLLTAWASTSGKLNRDDVSQEVVTSQVVSETSSTTTRHYSGAGYLSMAPMLQLVEYSFQEAALMEMKQDSYGRPYSVVGAEGGAWLHRKNVLETFNGTRFFQFDQTVGKGGSGSGTGGSGGGTSTGGIATVAWRYAIAADQRAAMDSAYAALRESVYSALVLQTRLRPYLDSIELVIDEAGVSFDTQALAALLGTVKQSDERGAMLDLVDLTRYAFPTLDSVGFDALGTLRAWRDALPAGSPLLAELEQLNVLAASTTQGTSAGDIYLGDSAANSFSGGAGNDIVDGQAGSDSLSGGDGDDWIAGGDGADSLVGNAGSDTLIGGAGEDTLAAGDGNDALDGGVGNDSLRGESGNNTYLFGRGDGQDTIDLFQNTSTSKFSVLRFKDGVAPADIVMRAVDASYWGHKADMEFSIAGTSDKILVKGFWREVESGASDYSVVQQVQFADATVWDFDAIKAMLFAGTSANDSIAGSLNADTIAGQAGSDAIDGMSGNDVIDGGTGGDMLHGNDGDDRVLGGTENDTMYGDNGNDVLEGGTGDDSVHGGAGNDTVIGGDGNDYMTGGDGDDAMDGNLGNDSLTGGYGNNTYLFGRGDGQDTIDLFQNTSTSKFSVLRFEEGVAPTDIVMRAVDASYWGYKADMEFSIAGTSDKILVKGFWREVASGASDYSVVQQVQFANGTVWDFNAIKAMLFAGTSANDSIGGSVAADAINGLAGSDAIEGMSGNDVIDGGAGGDMLHGNDGDDRMLGGTENDTLYGDNGNDTLEGGTGDDAVHGGAGNDTVIGGDGNDYMTGGDGDDVMDGNLGNDSLTGGYGNNTYVFGRGDGQDTIELFQNTSTSKFSVLRFKDGVAPADIVMRAVDASYWGYKADMEFTIAGTSDKILVKGFWREVAGGASDYSVVQQVQFANGTVWDFNAIKALLFAGTSANDSIAGSYIADTITGQAGSDAIDGMGGNDTIDGGAGGDTLHGNDGDDRVLGGTENDTLYGDNGSDTLEGGTGDDAVHGGAGNDTVIGGDGNDYMTAGDGDDVMDGNLGNDSLAGEYGNNSYLFGRGDGQDSIELFQNTSTSKLSVLRFKDGVAPADIVMRAVDASYWGYKADMEFSISGTSDKILVKGFWREVVNGASDYSVVQQVQFANGTVWDFNTIKALLFAGTSGNDSIAGSLNADTIAGQAGNDVIDGMNGNDLLDGGTGSDTLAGGVGDDTYVVDAGGDQVVESSSQGVDIVRSSIAWTLGSNLENLTLTGTAAINGTGNDLLNSLTGNAAANTLTGGAGNDMLDGGGGIDTLVGGSGDDTYIVDGADDVITESAGAGADTVKSSVTLVLGSDVENLVLTGTRLISGTGNAAANTLTGNSAANTLTGGDGADWLDGGGGLDTLIGGAQGDTYAFGRGYGNDKIQENDATAGVIDRVRFGSGIAQSDLSFARSGFDMTVAIAGATDQLVVKDWYRGTQYRIEEFSLFDGTIVTMSPVQQLVDAMASFDSAPLPERQWSPAAGNHRWWHGGGGSLMQAL